MPPDPTSKSEYWLTRALYLRLLGFVYFFAFLSLIVQVRGLFFADGILPISSFLERFGKLHAEGARFLELPSLFWFQSGDTFLLVCAAIGIVLSLAVMFGAANSLMMAILWLIYLSFVNTGQIFYGYGWEILLLEAGFLAIFFCPLLDLRMVPKTPPPYAIIVLLRWLTFRIMLGAGLIKLRSGDPCWRELTCLIYHYETQPLPNPLSWYFHHLPPLFHTLGAAFNHFVEIVVPWFLFGPRRVRHIAGVLVIVFQLTLILSGNLSFLNYLTIAVAVAAFDDRALSFLFPRRLVEKARAQAGAHLGKLQWFTVAVVTVLLVALSGPPVMNLIRPNQLMNASFDAFHLVNTYGAFGTVGQRRDEVIVEGTTDEVLSENTVWKEYEFLCKPGSLTRRPCVIAPFQPRLDWQIWFAAMQRVENNPWLIKLVLKLLQGDPNVSALLANDPFKGEKPRYIRGELYRYRFVPWGDTSGAWWTRERVRTYFPPLSLDPRPAARKGQ